jgi:hypothetical protein
MIKTTTTILCDICGREMDYADGNSMYRGEHMHSMQIDRFGSIETLHEFCNDCSDTITQSIERIREGAIKADTKIIHMRGDEVIPQYSLIEIGDRGYANIAYGDVPNIGVAGELLTAKYIELSDNGTWVNSDGER